MAKKHTIGNVTAGLMFALAAPLEALQGIFTMTGFLIPLAWMVTSVAWIILGFWFFLAGAYKGKKAERQALTALAFFALEAIPGLNGFLPGILGWVAVTVVQTRLRDAAEGKLGTETPRAAAQQRLARMRAARARRMDELREQREETESGRHAAANDNEPGEQRQAA